MIDLISKNQNNGIFTLGIIFDNNTNWEDIEQQLLEKINTYIAFIQFQLIEQY